jgi:hypothetical protein
MIEIIAKKHKNGSIYFEATESGGILDWNDSLSQLLIDLSKMTHDFENDLIKNS